MTLVTYQIPLSSFVALGSAIVNTFVLKQQLVSSSLSVDVPSVELAASVVRVTFDGPPTDADDVSINTVVAAHTGGSFAADFLRAEANGQQNTTANDTPIDLVTLNSGQLRAGTYHIEWYCEHELSAAAGGVSSKVQVRVNRSNGGWAVRATDAQASADWSAFSGKMYFENIMDGETLNVSLQLMRSTAGTSEIASGQRARVFITRSPD
jgi:hypothetical protein